MRSLNRESSHTGLRMQLAHINPSSLVVNSIHQYPYQKDYAAVLKTLNDRITAPIAYLHVPFSLRHPLEPWK